MKYIYDVYMKRIEIESGKIFGKLIVIKRENIEHGPTIYVCKCNDCGNEKLVIASILIRIKSGGCNKCKSTTHGDYLSKEYRIYRSMLARCRPNDRQAKDYYNRGIVVCDEWRGRGGYERFIEHIGRRPSNNHTLDRIDNDKGYKPGNVRWAIGTEQHRNKRSNKIIEIDGISRCLIEWSEVSGIDGRTILARLNRGWPAKDAVFRCANHGVPLDANNQASVVLNIRGKSLTVKEWAMESFVSATTIMRRLSLGWAPEDAVFCKNISGEHLKGRKMLTIDGDTKTMMEWVALSGINYQTAYSRLKRGLNPKEAIFSK